MRAIHPILFLLCLNAAKSEPECSCAVQEVFDRISKVSNDLRSRGYNMDLFNEFMNKLDDQMPQILEVFKSQGQDVDAGFDSERFNAGFDEFVQWINIYSKKEEVKELWNIVMKSIEDVKKTVENAAENTYEVMRPEIDQFVWRFDEMNSEKDLRIAYRVLKKYFTKFLNADMVQDFVVEILEEIEPICKMQTDLPILMNKFESRGKRNTNMAAFGRDWNRNFQYSDMNIFEKLQLKCPESNLEDELSKLFANVDSVSSYDDLMKYVRSFNFKMQVKSVLEASEKLFNCVSEDEFVKLNFDLKLNFYIKLKSFPGVEKMISQSPSTLHYSQIMNSRGRSSVNQSCDCTRGYSGYSELSGSKGVLGLCVGLAGLKFF